MRLSCIGLMLAFSLTSCVNLQLHPVEFNTPPPSLGLSKKQALPLNIAVVIPDPMPYRYYYTPPRRATGGARRTDQTDQMQKIMLVGSELARLSSQTFPSIFRHAAVLRNFPDPGEYDAVVEIKVLSIDQVSRMHLGLFSGALISHLWMDWEVKVYDKNAIEIFSRKSTSEKRKFKIKGGFSEEPLLKALGDNGGQILGQITKEAALAAYAHLSGKGSQS